jgi:hypothetical protein
MNMVMQRLADLPEAWTCYHTLVDWLGRPVDDVEVMAAPAVLLDHAQVQGLIARAAT